MNELQDLLRQAQRAIKMGANPDDVDEFVSEESKGKARSVADLVELLRRQDISPGVAEGVARSATQGLTFGGADEIAGLVYGKDTAELEREANKSFRSTHPKTAIAAEVLGALAPLIASAGASAPGQAGLTFGGNVIRTGTQSLANLALKGGAVGAASGAVSGGLSSDPGERLAGAERGAKWGGALGAGLGVATKPIAGIIGGIPNLIQDLLNPTAAAERRATTGLVKALPADAGAIMGQIEAQRPGMGMAADVSPTAAKALRASSIRSPAVADAMDKLLEGRASGAGERVAEDLVAEAGAPRLNAFSVRQAMEAAKRPTMDKIYKPLERLYPVVEHPALDAAMKNPQVAQMFQAVAPGEPMGFLNLQRTLRALEGNKGEAITSGRGPYGPKGENWADAADKLNRAMEEAMPAYRAANAGTARTFTVMRAFDDGAQSLRKDPREIAADIARTQKAGGTEAADAYRMAWLDQLAMNLRERGINALGDNAIVEERLRSMFPNEKALQRFLAKAEVERMMNRTAKIAPGGSSTAANIAMEETLTGSPAAGLGTKEGMWQAAMSGAEKALFGDLPERSAEIAGRRLMTQGPKAGSVISRIDEARRRLLLRAGTENSIGGTLLPGLFGQQAGFGLFDQQ